MTTLIVITGSILAIVGVGVAIWSIITTRKKYSDAYMRRKRGQKIKNSIRLDVPYL